MTTRRDFLMTGAAAAAVLATGARAARAANAPGITDKEIKIGQTMPYSGPASAYGVIGKTEAAYFKMINEQGGVNGRMFLLSVVVLVGAFVLMIVFSEFRRQRIFAYLDPWNPTYAQGKAYQLTHSLIAFGRGEIFGQGLGASIEKLHYLPEAHTDFVFATMAEEWGMLGGLFVIGTFAWVLSWGMKVARAAPDRFAQAWFVPR